LINLNLELYKSIITNIPLKATPKKWEQKEVNEPNLGFKLMIQPQREKLSQVTLRHKVTVLKWNISRPKHKTKQNNQATKNHYNLKLVLW